jgi:putative ABC transport system substrate-binding protein
VIRRRHLVFALCAGAFSAPLASLAQPQQKVPRIGLLLSETLSIEASRVDALRAGLRDLGYVEGKNIAIEYRSADGNYDRLPELALELASLEVDVIVAFGTKAMSAVQRATTKIPVVDPVMGDPVALGLGGSLARPEGNITGSVQFSPEVYAKRLEFLKEAAPRVTRVAILLNPTNAGSVRQLELVRVAANALKLELQVFDVRNANELQQTFAAMAQGRVEAVVISTDTLFRANAKAITDLAARQRLPLAGPREFAAVGGLIGYSADADELYRRAAYFVDRLLKGAKPADLPMERATKLYLVVNLRAAKQLGITIPQSLLVRADEVIR